MAAAAGATPSAVNCPFHSSLPPVSASDGWVLRLLEASAPPPPIYKRMGRGGGLRSPRRCPGSGGGGGTPLLTPPVAARSFLVPVCSTFGGSPAFSKPKGPVCAGTTGFVSRQPDSLAGGRQCPPGTVCLGCRDVLNGPDIQLAD